MSAEKRWKNLNIAFESFRAHIKRKQNPDHLSLVDLLHTSNFKGGNSSITSDEASTEVLLRPYSKLITQIRGQFGDRQLGSLNRNKLDKFKDAAQQFVELSINQPKIKGFGPSYASGLLCAHFPELAPVLDRNVLAGSGVHTAPGSQVPHIERHYRELIETLHSRLSRDKHLSLRELDRELFIAGALKLKKQRKARRAPRDAT